MTETATALDADILDVDELVEGIQEVKKEVKEEKKADPNKIKIGVLALCKPALDALDKAQLRSSAAFRFSFFYERVLPAIQKYNGLRLELCEKYLELNADKTEYLFTNEENARQFSEELDPLFNEEVEINCKPITMFELGDAVISSEHLRMLKWLIKE